MKAEQYESKGGSSQGGSGLSKEPGSHRHTKESEEVSVFPIRLLFSIV